MYKLYFLLSVFLFSCVLSVSTSYGQLSDKELRKEIKKRAVREARKEARKMKKEGWETPPGSPPLEKILERAWEKQYQETEKGGQRYITADGNAVAGNYTAAEAQAIEMGKLQLAGAISTKVASLVSANIGNTELSDDDAETITEFVQSAKNIIAQELGYVDAAFKLRRKKSNGNKEVSVRLFYDTEQALSIVRKQIKKELKDKVKTNEEDLRKLMGL